jgi:hypothetical protein
MAPPISGRVRQALTAGKKRSLANLCAPWKKGQSGNPRTKPFEKLVRNFLESADVAADSQAYAERYGLEALTRGERLLANLYEIATGPGYKSADRIASTNLLFSRAYGQPRAVVDVGPQRDEEVIDLDEALSDDDLRRIADADAIVLGAAAARAALPPGDPEPK